MEAKKLMVGNLVNQDSEKRTFNIAIINPDNGEIVSVDEWRKEQNPTRASVVCLNIGDRVWLAIAKCNTDGGKEHNFDEANDIASKVTFDGCNGATFRLPTRRECVDIYDARFAGLDEALSLIGGDPLTRWLWTCESDTDPECNATYAFFFGGYGSTLNNTSKYFSFTVRPVFAFETTENLKETSKQNKTIDIEKSSNSGIDIMKTISDYTIYCTEEQTKKALELGAPIVESIDYRTDGNLITMGYMLNGDVHDKNRNGFGWANTLLIPTAEQMRVWLESQGFYFRTNTIGCSVEINFVCIYEDNSICYPEGILAAIDAALGYLIKNKK